jgi:hypothetical protein
MLGKKKGKKLFSSDSKVLSIIIPEIASKTAIKHSEVISVRATNAFKQINVKL